METGTMSNSQRGFTGGGANTTGQNKGRDASDEHIMKVAPLSGPSPEQRPVAEPLSPFELTQFVQRFGSVVFALNSLVQDMYKSLDNPAVKQEQKDIIVTVIDALKPLPSKVFKCGVKLNDAFLPSRKKRVR